MPLDNSHLTRPQVETIQNQLRAAGFDPGPTDGVLGPRTESAIIAFKRSHGLRPRPYVGPETLSLLSQGRMPLEPQLPWMVEAYKAMKRHEVWDNQWLKAWLKSDGYALGDPAKFPWCGDFVETAIRLGLPNEPIPSNPYWALNWRKFGVPCPPVYGAVASISREGGGHVCFLVGQDQHRYYCAGGNQGNKSCVVPIDRTRFTPECFRWPLTWSPPDLFLPLITSTDATSSNEA